MSYYPQFSALVNEALTRLDRSSAWLASRLGVSQSTVGRWLNQDTRPGDPEAVVRIADILGMGARAQELLVAAGYGYQSTPDAPQPSERASNAQTEHVEYRPDARLHGVPVVATFYGRDEERKQLRGWVRSAPEGSDARLVGIFGQGGLGKTSLMAYVTQIELQHDFDAIVWCSLLNGPLLSELLDEILNALSGEGAGGVDTSTDQRIAVLIGQLRRRRCLLLLDNVESILSPADDEKTVGNYRSGYKAYAQLFATVASQNHTSCLLFTSRERPHGLARLETDYPWVHTLTLRSLDRSAGLELLRGRGLVSAESAQQELIARYSGNPLALNLVCEIVQSYFGGDLDAYLAEETPIFADIRRLLDEQFARLTEMERHMLFWIAVQRTPVTLQELRKKFLPSPPLHVLLDAVRGLERRSMLETAQGHFSLQNVITEYATDRMVDTICSEVQSGMSALLASHALLDTEATAYVQRSQRRMLHAAILAKLSAAVDQTTLRLSLLKHIQDLRRQPPTAQGYAPGNLLNLLVALHADLRGEDFSRLALRHTDLTDAYLPNVNFSGSEFDHAHFTHTFNNVISLAYSPDGTVLAAGSFSSNIYLWRTDSWQPLATLTGHTNWIFGLEFSPDGQTLASGSYDGTIRFWDVERRSTRTVTGPGTAVTTVSFRPDGKVLASIGNDGRTYFWRVDDGELLGTLPVFAGESHKVVWHPDGLHILLPSESGDGICLWEYDQHRATHELSPTSKGRSVFAVSNDGSLVAGVAEGDTLHVWSLATGQLLMHLKGHTDVITRVLFGPDGEWLVTSSLDRTVRIWDLQSGSLRHTLTAHADYVLGLAVSPRGDEIASGANDHSLAIWDAHTGQLKQYFQGYSGLVAAVAFGRDGQTVASGSYSGQLDVWDVSTGERRWSIPQAHQRGIYSLAYSPDGNLLASGNAAGVAAIQLRHSRSGRLLRTLEAPTGRMFNLAFSPDGECVIGVVQSRSIGIWETSGLLRRLLQGHTKDIYGLAFSPDGKWIASASSDHTVRLWNTVDQTVVVCVGHGNWCRSVAFHPHHPWVASASDDRTVRLWRVPDGAEIAVLRGHEAQVRSLVFLPNGALILSGSYDGTLRLWDVQTGDTVRVFEGHTDFVMSVDVSPDGRLAVSGGFDETVRIWDVETGECLRVLKAERPYEGMNIWGARGLSATQITSLHELGAVERI